MESWEAAGIPPDDACIALVCARVYEDGKLGDPDGLLGFVLVKTTDHHDPKFKLPGGSREAEETPLDAAVRELFEETGLMVPLERFTFIDAQVHDYKYRHWSALFTADLEHGSLGSMHSTHPQNGGEIPHFFTTRGFREEAAYGQILKRHLKRMKKNRLVPSA